MSDSQLYAIVYSKVRPCRYYYVINCSARGYSVLEASSYKDCEQLALTYSVGMLIVCGLPTVEATIAEVRQSEILKPIPTVTIGTVERDIDWCQRWNVIRHIIHPLQLPELIQLLDIYAPPFIPSN